MQSSPFSDAGGKVHLHLTAGSQLAEVFLIDHEFALVSRAVGELHADVEQGVYKVKAQVGEASTERVVILNQNETIDLSADLRISSPVPLDGTARNHEFHMYPAAEESRAVARGAGGAQIFLCARRWSTRELGYDESTKAPDLSLHHPTGATIIDLGESGRGDRSLQDPMLTATVDVDPGAYLLRWQDDSGAIAEQTVEAVKDWQTQVFLLEDAKGGTHQAISILMGQGGFDWDDPKARLADDARIALADERRVASQVITEALFAKFERPMLGLFGAHLMLVARDAEREATQAKGGTVRAPVEFEQGYFDGVVDNLAGLLGPNQPDVVALATQSGHRPIPGLEPVTSPPMLWRSWLLLIEASNDRPELLPADTWRPLLQVMPVRPFLAWSPLDDEEQAVDTWQRSVAPFVHASLAPGENEDEVMRRLTTSLLVPRSALEDVRRMEPA